MYLEYYNRSHHIESVQSIFMDLRMANSEVFVRFEHIRNTGDDADSNLGEITEYAELSVLSKRIYEYDRETILEDGSNLSIMNYRPFFVSIIVLIDRDRRRIFQELNYNWMQAVINPIDESASDPDSIYEAMVICSSSPFQISRAKIKILQNRGPLFFDGIDINQFVKNNYNDVLLSRSISNANDIDLELGKAWKRTGYDYIDFYNVGHGNADYIVGGSRRILYDIGYQYRRIPKMNSSMFPKATHSFAKLKPSLVIISHWDSDHFMGCVYASDDIFKVKWIAPTLTSSSDKTFSLNSFRLAAFLQATGKLMLVDRTGAGRFCSSTWNYNGYNLVLRMGSSCNSETPNITKRNREGLYIEISDGSDTEAILAGDVPYNSMWGVSFTSDRLALVHVPHHCSEMKLDKLIASSWRNDFKKAIISTDKNKTGTGYDENATHKHEVVNKFGNNIYYTIGDLTSNIDELRSIRLLRSGNIKERR